MSKLVYLIAMFLAPSISNAQSLKDTMATMGQNIKVIILSIKGQELTLATQTAAEELKENISAAALQIPDSAATEEQKKLYASTMQSLAQKSEALLIEIQAALATDPKNVTKAEAALKEVMAIRADGHAEFKNN